MVVLGRRAGRRWDVVGKGYVAGCSKAADIGAVFVLNTKEGPYASAADFRQADDEAENSRVLEIVGEDGIEDPIETEDWIEDHGEVVDPGPFVAEDVSKKWMLGVGIAKT